MVPVPDPTKLTTDAVMALEKQLKELFTARLEAIAEKFSDMDRRFEALVEIRAREIARISEVTEEKFKGVAIQFEGRDTALTAALMANGQAAQKSENAFTKQLDSISALINAALRAVDDKIDDLKARVTIVEAIKIGTAQNTDSSFKIISAIGVFVAVAIAIGSIVVGVAVK